ncbi:LOW QUALITY PROTEIN: cytidylate kinase [Geomicrobium sp. JCM 19038]|nr:LOW QUALITY PROTEIN: cytidylate kinase [Geomicrobium sp. JCM 19038]
MTLHTERITLKINIAIDGPAGSGKSTVASLVAEELGYLYIDTGAMYRRLRIKQLMKLSHLKKEACNYTVMDFKLSDEGNQMLVNEELLGEEIRTREVTSHVSEVSAHRLIREAMVKKQQQLATEKGVVLDGRDIGTFVLPDAELKIYLFATATERANRRHQENVQKGIESSFEEIYNDLIERDRYDTSRAYAPLKQADDAEPLDTTNLTITEVIETIVTRARLKEIETNDL